MCCTISPTMLPITTPIKRTKFWNNHVLSILWPLLKLHWWQRGMILEISSEPPLDSATICSSVILNFALPFENGMSSHFLSHCGHFWYLFNFSRNSSRVWDPSALFFLSVYVIDLSCLHDLQYLLILPLLDVHVLQLLCPLPQVFLRTNTNYYHNPLLSK